MAQVTLAIGGRRYDMMVRDGQEAHFERLAGIVDETIATLGSRTGVNETRLLLMAALLLADRTGGEPPAPTASAPGDTDDLAGQIGSLAERLEKLADMLEKRAGGA